MMINNKHQYVNPTRKLSVDQCVNPTHKLSVNQYVNQTHKLSVNQYVNQTHKLSVDQCVNPTHKLSIDQCVNPTHKLSVDLSDILTRAMLFVSLFVNVICCAHFWQLLCNVLFMFQIYFILFFSQLCIYAREQCKTNRDWN
jgi:hypothetical protein